MSKKEQNLQLLDIIVGQCNPKYREMLASFKMFYNENGYLSDKQRQIVADTVKFTCFGVKDV